MLFRSLLKDSDTEKFIMGLVAYGLMGLSQKMKLKRFSNEIKIIDRCPVENGVSLMIIDVRGQQILMSVSTKETVILKDLKTPEDTA